MALGKAAIMEILQDLDIRFINNSSTTLFIRSDSGKACLYVKSHKVWAWQIYKSNGGNVVRYADKLTEDIDNEFDFQDWFITNFDKYK
jgi:hypothetical protein